MKIVGVVCRPFAHFGCAAALLLAGALLPAAFADSVIYDGGAPDQGGQIYSETPSVAAMSFSLASSSTLTGVTWWGGCFASQVVGNTCGSSPNFTVDIWSDVGGSPGSVLDFVPLTGVSQTATGNMIGGTTGWDEYLYSASLPSFALAAGTTYFLSIQETTTEPSGTWGWETTSSAPAGAQLQWDSGSGFGSLPEKLAFQLQGTTSAVPEPSSLGLSLLGVVVAGLLARRRRPRTES